MNNTSLSINLNKLALLRNARGDDFPNLMDFAFKFIDLGADGITVHPRPDERHIKKKDVFDLKSFLEDFPDVEFNIEGFPSSNFLEIIKAVKPTQCTLVPDKTHQLTSDHGWDVIKKKDFLLDCGEKIKSYGSRSALFLDPDIRQIAAIPLDSFDRIELYTAEYAKAYSNNNVSQVFLDYSESALLAQNMGLEVNAGHDLNLQNLAAFLEIPNIMEVSIGHALTVECIQWGMAHVVKSYLQICKN